MNKKRAFLLAGLFLICLLIGAGIYMQRASEEAEYIILSGTVNEDTGYIPYFKEKIEQKGGKVTELSTSGSTYSSLQQYQLLQAAVTKNTKCIVVDAVTQDNLSALLPQYLEQGIKVISAVNKVREQDRNLHIGIADTVNTGQLLMQDVLRATKGTGHFLIISDSMQNSTANSLVLGIRSEFEETNPDGLYLDDILRAPESPDEVLSKFKDYLQKGTQVSAVVCLSQAMTETVCAAVKECDLQEQVQIIGFSSQEDLDKECFDDVNVKLYSYDEKSFGYLLAEAAMLLTEGEIESRAGEKVTLSDGKTYEIQENIHRTSDDEPGSELYFFDSLMTSHEK